MRLPAGLAVWLCACSQSFEPQTPPYSYSACSTNAQCPSDTPTCLTHGTDAGMCSKPCSVHADCPTIPQDFGGQYHHGHPALQGRCISIGAEASFCTYASGWECALPGQEASQVYSSVAPRPDAGTNAAYVCLPIAVACGDGECMPFEIGRHSCPADCIYRNCSFRGPGFSGYCTSEGDCEEVSLDGGAGRSDGGYALEATANGICTSKLNCTTDAQCKSWGKLPALCVGGLSTNPVCIQSCSAAGQDFECLLHQRCVTSTTRPGVAICVPDGSLLSQF